jgi:putative nucleotidyltransferase with HDIG domain
MAHSNASSLAGRRRLSPLRLYVYLVVAVGAAIIAESLFALIHTPQPAACLLFGVLAIVAGVFTMKMASVSANVSVTDTFFIAAAMLFGAAPATILVAIASAVVSCRRRHGRQRILFNTAAPALSMWLGAQTFFRIAGASPLAQGSQPVHTVIIPLLCMTAVFFLFNTGLTATAVALDTGAAPFAVWRKHFLWLWLNFLAAASVAFCLILLMQQVSLAAAAIVIPLLIIFHATLRSSYGRLDDAERHLDRMDRLYLSTIETLAMAIDAKDDVTHNHVRRVQAYAVGLARELGVGDETMLKALKAGALLHDTGKLAVPEHILNKPGKLTEAEFETMKLHVDVGADILSLVDFPYPVVPIVRCHHESWDGTGYPRGISGEDIPIGARILSVVDCFDALTSDRPYRQAMSSEAAFDILRERRGKMYDPRVVDTFISIQAKISPAEVSPPHQEDVMLRMSRVKHQSPVEPSPVEPHLPAGGQLSDDGLAFVSLSRLASGECTVADVLALASTLLRDTAAPSTAVWYILDQDTNALTVAHAAGSAADLFRGLSIPVGSRLSGWVAAHRQPIVNSDPALDLGAQAAVVPLQSCLSVPLVTGASLVGVLTLYSSQPKAFSDDQGRLLQMIAPHVANAMSRARRYEAAGPDVHAPSAEKRAPGGSLRLVANRVSR